MNYPMAIVIAAAMIAGAIFFSNQNGLSAEGNGEWAAVGVNQVKNHAWAVNTLTGDMRGCTYDRGDVLCWSEDTLP